MAKKQSTEELLEGFDATLDKDEFRSLERSSPILAQYIRGLVGNGMTPMEIATHVIDTRPAKWLQAQQVMAAARYVQREIED